MYGVVCSQHSPEAFDNAKARMYDFHHKKFTGLKR